MDMWQLGLGVQRVNEGESQIILISLLSCDFIHETRGECLMCKCSISPFYNEWNKLFCWKTNSAQSFSYKNWKL